MFKAFFAKLATVREQLSRTWKFRGARYYFWIKGEFNDETQYVVLLRNGETWLQNKDGSYVRPRSAGVNKEFVDAAVKFGHYQEKP